MGQSHTATASDNKSIQRKAARQPTRPGISPVVRLLGPAQAVAITPFCGCDDVVAWSCTCAPVFALLRADAVWQQLVVAHYRPGVECFARAAAGEGPGGGASSGGAGSALQEVPQHSNVASAESMVVRLQDAQKVYGQLRRKSRSPPFVLEKRARLLLEIHELREWDKHLKNFESHRQANYLADAFNNTEAAARLRGDMAPEALELVSLQAMMGDGRVPRLVELPEVQWGPSAEADLHALIEKRVQQRRRWWQKQREFLLQDLEWH